MPLPSAIQGLDYNTVLIAIGAIAVMVIVLKALNSGVKKLFKIAVNAAVGCLILFAFSMMPGVNFTVEWWHALLTGLIGIPVAVIIIVLNLLL